MIHIWTTPRADLNTLAGGNALAYGVAGGLSTLGDSIGKAIEANKTRNATAKYFEGIIKSSPTLQASLGMDEHEFSGLSADDKIARARGVIAANEIERQQRESAMREQEQQARMDEYARRTQEAQANAGLAESILGPAEGGLASNERYDTETGVAPPPPTSETLAARTGLSPVGASILRGYRSAGVAPPTSVVDELMRSAVGGKTGHEAYFTSKPGELQPVRDETGELVPGEYILPTGPNTAQPFRKEATPGQVTSYYDPVSGNSFYRTGGKNSRWQHIPAAKEFAPDELAAMHAEFKAASDPFAIQLENAALPKDQRRTAAERIEMVAKKWSGRRSSSAPPSAAGPSATAPSAPTAAAPATSPTTGAADALKAEAQRAIDMGADPVAVKARLAAELKKLKQ